MEVIVTLRVPESTPLLTTIVLVYQASTSAICLRLVAVVTVFGESRVVMWAVLPADGAISMVAFLAGCVAHIAMLFHTFRAR